MGAALHEETGVHMAVVLPALPQHMAPIFADMWPLKPMLQQLAHWYDQGEEEVAARSVKLRPPAFPCVLRWQRREGGRSLGGHGSRSGLKIASARTTRAADIRRAHREEQCAAGTAGRGIRPRHVLHLQSSLGGLSGLLGITKKKHERFCFCQLGASSQTSSVRQNGGSQPAMAGFLSSSA